MNVENVLSVNVTVNGIDKSGTFAIDHFKQVSVDEAIDILLGVAGVYDELAEAAATEDYLNEIDDYAAELEDELYFSDDE